MLSSLAVAALILAASLIQPAQAADPFYTSLMREGALAASRGDHATAARDLRIACFGLLEETELLAECLVRLGVAQAAIDDEAGFQQTFQRLLEIEERFGSYSASALPAELRGEFEREVARRIPQEILRSSSPFQSIAGTDQPEDPCLLGKSLAGQKNCFAAVQALSTCEKTKTDSELALIRLECLTKLDRWVEASEFYASIEGQPRANSRISRLGKKAERMRAKQGAPAEDDSPVQPTAGQDVTGDDRAQLEEVRTSLKIASEADELAALYDSARKIAKRHPDWSEAQFLAAESAYRLAFWKESAVYFNRGGDPGDDNPRLLFFLAFSLYEIGDQEGAAAALSRALPELERDPSVAGFQNLLRG